MFETLQLIIVILMIYAFFRMFLSPVKVVIETPDVKKAINKAVKAKTADELPVHDVPEITPSMTIDEPISELPAISNSEATENPLVEWMSDALALRKNRGPMAKRVSPYRALFDIQAKRRRMIERGNIRFRCSRLMTQ